MREAFMDMDNSVMFSSTTSTVSASTSSVDQLPDRVEPDRNTYLCVITDMTDPTNSCKRHVINLSANYLVEDLIQEAGSHYSYDPFTFCLMWKCPTGDMINVSEIQTDNLNLADLGLKVCFVFINSYLFIL